MTQTIATDRTLGERQSTILSTLAACMIPPQDGLPSASDPRIVKEVLALLAGHAEVVNNGLERLHGLATQVGDSAAETLPAEMLISLVATLRTECPAFVTLFESTVAACYYRDDRVLRALGLPDRAPFPVGNDVAPTDWSLLEPVRARTPFYRTV
ncbi:MAG: hypothetical protein H6993_18595 [Pseudomonadales bacterium]|nr:hypothetical protein [Pseudomonadales bacterium]MCP5185982.1 hypothetical protein [Pseudomonadales bacterium]